MAFDVARQAWRERLIGILFSGEPMNSDIFIRLYMFASKYPLRHSLMLAVNAPYYIECAIAVGAQRDGPAIGHSANAVFRLNMLSGE